MSEFGIDLDCADDVDPGMREATGEYLLRQDIRWRLSTRRGLLINDPNYGIDLRDLVNADLTEDELAHIPSMVAAELDKDDRILSPPECTVEWDAVANILTISVRLTTANGPYMFVFAITSDKIDDVIGG